MSTPKEYIRQGLYVDYGRSWGYQTQYLSSSPAATIWTNALGIFVAVSITRGFRLVLRVYRLLQTQSPASRHSTPEAILWYQFLDWLNERLSGAILLAGRETNTQTRSTRAPFSALLKVFLLAVSYISILACSTLTSKLATDARALSNHADCGVYTNPLKSCDRPGYRNLAFDSELESAALAENCAHASKGADGCNFFLEQSIPYQMANASCPFPDATMCAKGDSQVVHFSTGPVNGHSIGVNTPTPIQFSRETTCSPVTMNKTFVRRDVRDGFVYFSYYYGHTRTLHSMPLTVSPLNRMYMPHNYEVTPWTSPGFVPIPALAPRNGSCLSLLFINSEGISYPEPNYDPIFPATEPHILGNRSSTIYYKASSEARILGCVDSTKWRISAYSDDWYDLDFYNAKGKSFDLKWLVDAHPRIRGGAVLLLRSLGTSCLGTSIQSRQGMGLAASKVLDGGSSSKLGNEHWKKEARQLFETALTRIQINARDIAQGSAIKYGWRRSEYARAELCDQTFLFNSQGWQNVHVAGSVWILVWSAILLLLAVPLDEDRLLAEPIGKTICHACCCTGRKATLSFQTVNGWAWNLRLMVARRLAGESR